MILGPVCYFLINTIAQKVSHGPFYNYADALCANRSTSERNRCIVIAVRRIVLDT